MPPSNQPRHKIPISAPYSFGCCAEKTWSAPLLPVADADAEPEVAVAEPVLAAPLPMMFVVLSETGPCPVRIDVVLFRVTAGMEAEDVNEVAAEDIVEWEWGMGWVDFG